jgi:hypothetical protein
MKLSVVKYKKLADDNILIVGFDNIATLSKLIKVCGNEVERVYTDENPKYLRVDGKKIKVNDKEYVIDQVLTKDEFQEMITTMKAAGNRLMDIKSKFDDTVYEVKI